MEDQFALTPVLQQYDAIAWVDHTTATHCFKVKAAPVKN